MSPEGYAATMDFNATGFSTGRAPMEFEGAAHAEGGDITAGGEYIQDSGTVYHSDFKKAEWPVVVEDHYEPAEDAFDQIVADNMNILNMPIRSNGPIEVVGTVASVKVTQSFPVKMINQFQDFIRRILFV